MAALGAERPSQPDLGSPFEYRDHHHVGDTDATDRQGDGAKAQQQPGEVLVDCGLGFESVGSWGGQIAFDLMLRWPELFATVLGAPGEFFLVEPDRWRVELASKAVFNGVGSDDEEWLPYVKAIHEGLVEAGVESVYVEFPGEGHRLSAEFDESVFFDFWSSHQARPYCWISGCRCRRQGRGR